MDLVTAFTALNWWGIILATLLGFFLLGGLWYGPLFGPIWLREFGFSEQELAQRNMVKVFAGALVLALFTTINLALFIGPDVSLLYGLMAGLLAGLGWVATLLGILYLFESRSFKAYAVNAGYCVVSLTVAGAVLGAM